MKHRARIESWPLRTPFKIAGYPPAAASHVVRVDLEDNGLAGRGEASGVYYKKDTPDDIVEALEAAQASLDRGVTREDLQTLLPPGGARNALDCALWEIEAARARKPVWQLAGLKQPRPLLTTYTIGADTPQNMARRAVALADARAIKLKLTGEPEDAERVRAVRRARPEVWLAVDGNQGFTPDSLESLIGALVEAQVSLIEQPLRTGMDHKIREVRPPIPVAADESVQSADDLESLMGLYGMINIKLDKCGGLTHGLFMAREAQRLGFRVMVGNMAGTSLSHAPAFLLGQLCEVVDLDGPLLLARDREPGVRYADGYIHCSTDVWGSGR